ncbi:MAG: DUF86 domain-containing protein [Flavobacteriales bacterium]|nr:DUF86 domain-containing protein [Flavobacteriales bacterium]
MLVETRVRLSEILHAIAQLEDCKRRCKEFSAFKNDGLMVRAAERCIMIIGESVIRISRSDPDISFTDDRKIRATRHIVVHEYEKVSAEVLWLIMERNITVLKAEVEALLKQHG